MYYALTRAWSRCMLNVFALPFCAPFYLSLPSFHFPVSIILHSTCLGNNWCVVFLLSLCVAAEGPGRSRRPADSVCVMNRGVPTTLCMAHNTSDPTWLSCLFVVHNRVAKPAYKTEASSHVPPSPFYTFLGRNVSTLVLFVALSSYCQPFYLWCNCDVSKTVFDCMSVIICVTIHVVNGLFVSTCGFRW